MEHRKRSRMQHKVELSTLLRLVIAKKGIAKFQRQKKNSKNLAKALATEALESLKSCDLYQKDTIAESLYAGDLYVQGVGCRV